MFIRTNYETGVSYLVIQPTHYEEDRHLIVSSSMMLVDVRMPREGDAVHLVAYWITDLSGEHARVDDIDVAFPLPHGLGDEAHRGGGPDARDAWKIPALRTTLSPVPVSFQSV